MTLERWRQPMASRVRLRRPQRVGRSRLPGGSLGRRLMTTSWRPIATRVAALAGLAGVLAWIVLLAVAPGVRWTVTAVGDLMTPDPVEMPVPVPGSRELRGAAVEVVMLDDSGSMLANDPEVRRHEAVRAYGAWLDQHGRSRDRFGVVRFAERATSSGALLRAGRLAGGADALAGPPEDGPDTLLLPAVRKALPMLAASPRGARRAALILTDGEVVDAAEALAELRKVTDHIEVIALDRDGTWDTSSSSWRAPGVRLSEARNQRPNELGAGLAKSFLRITGEEVRR